MSTASRMRAAVLLFAVLWAASLPLPALETTGGTVLHGFEVLGRGWLGTRAGVVSWWANPAFVLALAAAWYRAGRLALTLAAFALVLALSSFAAAATAAWLGTSVPDFGFGAGFYVWLAAYFGLVAACLIVPTKQKGGARS